MVCCGLICLTNLVERCCGDGQEKLNSQWTDWFCEDCSNVDSDEEEEEIVILPPFEIADAETNCNSDISDDKNKGLIHHIPCHLLTASC